MARLARNTLWSRSPLSANPGWRYRGETAPDAGLLARFAAAIPQYPTSLHGAEFLSFMLRCPGADFGYFELLQGERKQGYFLLARVGGQARLADLRILSDEQADWNSAVATCVQAAASFPENCELFATATTPRMAQALESNGFRFRGESPVFVYDRKKVLDSAERLQLSMLDDDGAFLNFPEYPYAT
jgi:hypothetical protein